MKICEVLKEEEVNCAIDSMFRMLCSGLISHDEFMGGVVFASSCGLLTDAEFDFLNNATYSIRI